MTKIGIKNYQKATYKNKLTLAERAELVTSAVLKITKYYENQIFGFDRFAISLTFIEYCTDIKFGAKASLESRYKFITETDVIEKITNALGTDVYIEIINEIENGVKFNSSTNPETKELIKALTTLIKTFNDNAESLPSVENINSMLGTMLKAKEEDDNGDKSQTD